MLVGITPNGPGNAPVPTALKNALVAMHFNDDISDIGAGRYQGWLKFLHPAP